MFERVIKSKVFLIGGGIVLILAVFAMLRNSAGGGAATAVTSTGPTDAQVAQQTQLALAQMQLQASSNQSNAELAAKQLDANVALQTANLQADLQHYAISMDAANQAAQISAQEHSDALQAQIAQWTINAQLAATQSNQAFQLDYAQAANASAEAMAQIQAGVINHQIDANQTVTIASLQAQAAQLASYLGAQVSINDSNNAAQVSQAQIAAGTARRQSSNNLIGGIVGGILGIFSDRRLKTDVTPLGKEADGLGVYAYRYRGDDHIQVGYMADEIRAVRPWALGPRVAGFDTVNYAAA